MAIAVFVLLAGTWFLVPYFYRKKEERRLAAIAAERRAIVLTYNGGPGATLTPRLLDLLDRYDVHATFFALGRHAIAYPELVQRALEAGHEVGSYTFNHTNAWKSNPVSAARDLIKGISVTSKLGGDIFSFRPPYGKMTILGLLHGAFRGLHYGWWTIDSQDSWDRRSIVDVLDEIVRKNGGVVLMHDHDSYARAPAYPAHPDHVIALTEQIIELARDRGFRIVTLASLRW